MKFVDKYSQDDLSAKTVIQSSYDAHGTIDNETDKVFAKFVNIDLNHGKHQKQFFIRTYNNLPFDPIGPEASRDIWRRTELKQVNESAFNFYLTYLQTRNSIYMTRTQRSYING